MAFSCLVHHEIGAGRRPDPRPSPERLHDITDAGDGQSNRPDMTGAGAAEVCDLDGSRQSPSTLVRVSLDACGRRREGLRVDDRAGVRYRCLTVERNMK